MTCQEIKNLPEITFFFFGGQHENILAAWRMRHRSLITAQEYGIDNQTYSLVFN